VAGAVGGQADAGLKLARGTPCHAANIAPMPAPAEIRKLVERFEVNLDTYRGGGYNETLLRRDFLDPLFDRLAYELYGLAEEEIEVVEGGA